VIEYLAPFPQVTVHEGEFSAVAPMLAERSYRVVHGSAGFQSWNPRTKQLVLVKR